MIWWMKFFGVMFLVAVNDICWTKWTMEVQNRKAIKAGLWSSGIYVAGGLTIISYLEDLRYMIAAIIASFLSTYFTVKKTNH